jgi:CspA family cold shock protein
MMMAIGTVKFFNQDKGYGFISPENGGTDVFVHVSAVEGGSPLRDGQKVSYDIGQDRKTGKSRAENVRSA